MDEKRNLPADGIDEVEHSADGIDLFNPDIPKAPALPRDLARMPNAQLPQFTDPPGRIVSVPGPSDPAAAARPHANAQLPPAGGPAATRVEPAPPADNAPSTPSSEPIQTVIASEQSRLSLDRTEPAAAVPQEGPNRYGLWLLLASLALLAFAGMRLQSMGCAPSAGAVSPEHNASGR